MIRNFIFGTALAMMLFSCSDEATETVKEIVADFELEVIGDAPNAQVKLTNNSENADTYLWTFGEGANTEESTEKETTIKVDKAGDFTITLVASSGDKQKKISKTVTINGNNAILYYEDLEFALDTASDKYGSVFSFETQKMYKVSEITTEIAPKVHLAFGSMGNVIHYFVSPTHEDFDIAGATATKVVNYESEPSITIEEFDAMSNDSVLSSLTIVDTDDGFGNSQIPGTILFELASGKKGVIKTKAINADRILVDINIQKY